MSSNAQGKTPRDIHLSLTSAGASNVCQVCMSFVLNFHARIDFQAHTTVFHDLWVLPVATPSGA